jgi:hypothetical protein
MAILRMDVLPVHRNRNSRFVPADVEIPQLVRPLGFSLQETFKAEALASHASLVPSCGTPAYNILLSL